MDGLPNRQTTTSGNGGRFSIVLRCMCMSNARLKTVSENGINVYRGGSLDASLHIDKSVILKLMGWIECGQVQELPLHVLVTH